MQHVFNDGGRFEAGYKGTTGDCVARSIAIATGKPYQEIYDALAKGNAKQRVSKRQRIKIQNNYAAKGLSFDTPEYKAYVKSRTKKQTAAHGINTTRQWFKDYMKSLGFVWVPTMKIGQGCTTHLTENELPSGRLVVAVSKHFTAVIDGVINDLYDCSRNGTRCVYGYYKLN